MEEIWVDIKGYEGRYMVSNFGNIMSMSYHQTGIPRVMECHIDNLGYRVVTLCNCGDRATKKVHRLVAEAFIENPNGYPFINHKDEDKTNNHVDNLEWCTPKYNVNYYLDRHNEEFQRIKGDAQRKHHKRFIQKTKDGKVIRIFNNIAEAKRLTGIHNLYGCIHGLQKTSGGYAWEFEE